MTLKYNVRFGPNDITGTPQALLHGGPFNGSIIELREKGCSSVTITEDRTSATYMNSGTVNSDDQHIFTCERTA